MKAKIVCFIFGILFISFPLSGCKSEHDKNENQIDTTEIAVKSTADSKLKQSRDGLSSYYFLVDENKAENQNQSESESENVRENQNLSENQIYENFNVPHIRFDTENLTFHLSGGFAISYAISGEYEIFGNILTATNIFSQSYTFEFLDEETLRIVEIVNSDYWNLKVGDTFKFSEMP